MVFRGEEGRCGECGNLLMGRFDAMAVLSEGEFETLADDRSGAVTFLLV